MTSTVAILHPGQMGAAVAAQAGSGGNTLLWHPAGRSQATIQRADRAGLTQIGDVSELLEKAQVVLSICPPAAAEDVANLVREHGFQGIYVEANAISPQRFTAIQQRLAASGVTVVDGAVIGPPPVGDATARLYLAGEPEAVTLVCRLFTGTLVTATPMDQEPPAASALKMAYASYQKASRALAAVAHALARRYDVTPHLEAEARRNSSSPLADPKYLPSVAARAWRWAPELRDVAQTLQAAHLPAELAQAAARTLDLWEQRKDCPPTLADVLNDLTLVPSDLPVD